MTITIQRIYTPTLPDDGFRILVDRLWPRGISKDKAKLDLWLKDIAPSDELRHWFNHDPAKWPEFRKKYAEELRNNTESLQKFHDAAKGKAEVTLLYGAHDEERSQAVVPRDFLQERKG